MNINQIKMKYIINLITIASIAFFSSCKEKFNNEEFLKQNGILDPKEVSLNFKGWNELYGKYVYNITVLNASTNPQLTYILADKKEEKILGLFNVNPFIIPSARVPRAHSNKMISNFEEMLDSDKAKRADLIKFNSILKLIPELKNFSWKNLNQNTIVSSIIQTTQFNFVSKKEIDTKVIGYNSGELLPDNETLLKDIFSTKDYLLMRRFPERLSKNTNLGEYVNKLGFEFEKNEAYYKTLSKYSMKDVMGEYSYDFVAKEKIYFFYPFISYSRPKTEFSSIVYFPAIETSEYSFTLDSEGFPVFAKKMYFVSLL